MDFTGITKPSCIKKARLFKKNSDFEIPVKSDVEYLNYYLKNGDQILVLTLFNTLLQYNYSKLIS